MKCRDSIFLQRNVLYNTAFTQFAQLFCKLSILNYTSMTTEGQTNSKVNQNSKITKVIKLWNCKEISLLHSNEICHSSIHWYSKLTNDCVRGPWYWNWRWKMKKKKKKKMIRYINSINALLLLYVEYNNYKRDVSEKCFWNRVAWTSGSISGN